jgi:preprotein translocase subunit YajC
MGNMFLAASSAASKSSSGSLNILLIVVVLFGVLYFVMIRPQRNKQRRAQEQQNAVVPGQRVRTTAGMYATVVGVDGDDVILEVAPGVEVRYIKRAIMQVIPGGEEPAGQPDYAADDDEGARVDAPAADAEAADDEATDHEVADEETSGHEDAEHDGEESPHAADDTPAQAGDESPNGSPAAAADERRAQGSV